MSDSAKKTDGNFWKILIGSCFGLGYIPIAPGTFSALVGVANYLLIVWLLPEEFHFGWILVSLLAWSYGTVALGAWAEEHYKTKDPGIFTTDEVAGFLMAILLFNGPNLISTIFWVFMSNRIIDIIKVPPARQAENLHGGWGILLDDLIAGVYAAIFCHILYRFAPVLFSV